MADPADDSHEELMDGSEASYLGRKFSALPVSKGGLGR